MYTLKPFHTWAAEWSRWERAIQADESVDPRKSQGHWEHRGNENERGRTGFITWGHSAEWKHGALGSKLLRLSRWRWQSVKRSTVPLWVWGLVQQHTSQAPKIQPRGGAMVSHPRSLIRAHVRCPPKFGPPVHCPPQLHFSHRKAISHLLLMMWELYSIKKALVSFKEAH